MAVVLRRRGNAQANDFEHILIHTDLHWWHFDLHCVNFVTFFFAQSQHKLRK